MGFLKDLRDLEQQAEAGTPPVGAARPVPTCERSADRETASVQPAATPPVRVEPADPESHTTG
jgi:hypothetical protein